MIGQRAAASAQRIYEVLDEPADCHRPAGRGRPRSTVAATSTSTTCRSITPTGHPSSHGFELHLRPGETVALVGRTGSGKSTAARLLARFYDVTGGAVRIDGHDVRDLTLPSLRHHIGMVLDEPFLFSVSIRDNIAYGRPDATFDEVGRRGSRGGRRRVHPRDARGLRHGRGRARLHALGRPAPAARDRPHARREPADPRPRRRDVRDRRADRAADPRRARAADDRAARRSSSPTASRRSASPTGSRSSRTAGSSPRARTPSCSRPSRATSRSSPRPRRTRAGEQSSGMRREPTSNATDRRLLRTAADDDVVRSRGLDADLGELADRDPELATHGGTR